MSMPEPGESQSEPVAAVSSAPALPAVPRERSGRSTGVVAFEPRVRLWFIIAAVLAAFTAYRTIGEFAQWSHDRHVVLAGTPATATIVQIANTQLRSMREPWSSEIQLSYTAGGKNLTVSGTLSEPPGGQTLLTVGQEIPIKYDPADPVSWTNKTLPPSLFGSIVVVYIMVPVILATGGAGLVQRRALAETWRSGELMPAAVLSASPTPIAPGHVRVTVKPSHGRSTPVGVYVPSAFGKPRRGDVVWILARKSGPAMAAQAFL